MHTDKQHMYVHVEYILKVLDPKRKMQSRLHAEIAHASITAIVCVRLFACVCVCEYCLRSSACARTCVQSHVRACDRTYVHVKSI